MKTALSSVGVVAVLFAIQGSAGVGAQSSFHLRGTIRGTEHRLPSNPDAGMSYGWQGHGRIKPIGPIQAAGREHSVGFIRVGNPVASLTLTDSRGTLQVQVVYSQTAGFAAIPNQGHYRITGGTGSYAGATGSGKVMREGGQCTATNGCTFPVRFTFR